MKWMPYRIPLFVIASGLAIVGLVYFQWTWMHHSGNLAEEIFNQRASIALCSALERYDELNQQSALLQGRTAVSVCSQTVDQASSLKNDSLFNRELKDALAFYQIPVEYHLVSGYDSIATESDQPQCVINLSSVSGMGQGFLRLEFPEKDQYVLSRMKAMAAATLIILIFTGSVLLFANWLLLRQKRLLQRNVDFFNNMAHEFRTPLSNVGLASNLLLKKHEVLKQDHLMSIIRKEVKGLLSQIERVLHIARVEDGRYAVEKQPLHLAGILSSVMEEMAMQIEEHKATVRFEGSAGDLQIMGDRIHLKNVFRNLLDNALKYGGDHPEIIISIREQATGVLISVKDHGIGFATEESKLIFEKFQRAQKSDLHDYKGFGLGLAYVKTMVELHQGSVRASSEARKGSRFDVFLPTLTHGIHGKS